MACPTKLITSTRQQAAASFSPDGSQIAFQSDRSGSWEIWKANRDGSNAVQLTHFHGPLTGTPRWSPDGRQIAFDSRNSGNSEIYVIGSDGGTPRQVTASSSGKHGAGVVTRRSLDLLLVAVEMERPTSGRCPWLAELNCR